MTARTTGRTAGRLLIADDQSLIREALRRALRNRTAELDVVKDGEEALKLLDKNDDYSAVVLDQRMPAPSGLEVIKWVRSGASASRYDVPFILITGHGERRVVEAAVQLDVDAVLAKPFTTQDFLTRLDNALAGRGTRHSPDAYADVRVPISSGEAAGDGSLSAHVFVSGKPLWYTAADLQQSRAAQCENKRLVPVDRLAHGMVLGQALYGRNGKLLAVPGLQLNDRFISRIQALAQEIEEYSHISIMEPEASA